MLMIISGVGVFFLQKGYTVSLYEMAFFFLAHTEQLTISFYLVLSFCTLIFLNLQDGK